MKKKIMAAIGLVFLGVGIGAATVLFAGGLEGNGFHGTITWTQTRTDGVYTGQSVLTCSSASGGTWNCSQTE